MPAAAGVANSTVATSTSNMATATVAASTSMTTAAVATAAVLRMTFTDTEKRNGYGDTWNAHGHKSLP
jgi:hypothetical protein